MIYCTHKYWSDWRKENSVDTSPFKLLCDKSLWKSLCCQYFRRNKQSNSNIKIRSYQYVPTYSDIILNPVPSRLHCNPVHMNSLGRHGSPVQFFFTWYWVLMAMIASTRHEINSLYSIWLFIWDINLSMFVGGIHICLLLVPINSYFKYLWSCDHTRSQLFEITTDRD